MFQPSDPMQSTTITVPIWMVPHLEQFNQLLQEVHDMAPGGDLEGLIESHLVDMNRQCYDTALRLRAQAADQRASEDPEAFPPSALSALPEDDAPRVPQAAGDSDPAR